MLIGSALGVALNVLIGCTVLYSEFFSQYSKPTFLATYFSLNNLSQLENVMDTSSTLVTILDKVKIQIFLDLALTIWILVIFKFLFRNQKIAIALSIIFVAMLISPPSVSLFAVVLTFTSFLFFTLMRFGFLAVVLFGYVNTIFDIPMTLHASAWYSGYGYLALAVIGVIVIYAFQTSLGGRELIDPSRFND